MQLVFQIRSCVQITTESLWVYLQYVAYSKIYSATIWNSHHHGCWSHSPPSKGEGMYISMQARVRRAGALKSMCSPIKIIKWLYGGHMADRAWETTLIGRGSEKAHSHIPSHPPSSCTLHVLHNSDHNGVVITINKPFLPAKHYLRYYYWCKSCILKLGI